MRWGEGDDYAEPLGPCGSEDLRRGSWWCGSLGWPPPVCRDSKSPPTSVALLWPQVHRRENVIGPAEVRCPSLVQSALVRAAGRPTGGSWEDGREREAPVPWQHYEYLGHLTSPII